MKKKLMLLALAVLSISASAVLASCQKETPVVSEDTTFNLVVRRFDGVDEAYNAKLTGEVLAERKIDVKVGQITVSDSLSALFPSEEGAHKVTFGEDYLLFTETTVGYSTSWFLTSGSFAKEPGYVDGDYQWSYMAYNGHYSNGVTIDFVEGLNTYTVVIDGYDGNIGTTPTY